jgi:hypothetical protein
MAKGRELRGAMHFHGQEKERKKMPIGSVDGRGRRLAMPSQATRDREVNVARRDALRAQSIVADCIAVRPLADARKPGAFRILFPGGNGAAAAGIFASDEIDRVRFA